MSKISVSVTDGTNVNLTVSPRPVQTITVSRGSTGTGTVTAVTANTPLSVTNGTTTPDLSISQANATTAGYLTAGDWSTFNSKVAAVSGTAPVTVTGTSNAIVSMAAATDSVSGYLTSTDHATFNAKIGSITSTDGSITVTGTTTRDLSVASSPNVIVEVRNNTGATLTKGTAVYINGAIGQLPTITKAQANTDATSAQTLGIMTTDLANNANGYVTIIGLVTNVNTSAYTDGQQLYLSPTVAGGLTATKPSAPQHLVYMAIVEHAHITQGKLFVKVQNGYELDELHDVQIISPTNGQTITYDASTNLWKNTTPTASGVTSVTATSPVQSTGGTTPVISLPAATTSTSGYLTSTDWNTFNNKQAALVSGTNIKTVNSNSLLGSGNVNVGTVTSVGGTGTISGISLSGTVTSTGNLTLGGSLDLSAPPVIGGFTPNTIAGTTITGSTIRSSGDIKSQNYGVNQPVYSLTNLGLTPGLILDETPQGYEKLTISASTSVDSSAEYNTTGISHTFNKTVNAPEFNGIIGGTTPNTITSAGIFTSVSNNYSFPGSTTGNTQLTLSDAGYTDITAHLYIDDGFQAPAFFSKDASNNFLPFYFFAGSGLIDPSGAGVTLKAATSGNWTLTFPTTTGSANQVLKTDGSGNTSWTDKFVLGAGSTSANSQPLKFTSGSKLTSVESGAVEYDGVKWYATNSETGSSRSVLDNSYQYYVTSTSGAIGSTIADLFASAAFTMQAGGIYVIEWHPYLTKTTSGTLTFTVTTSQTPQAITAGFSNSQSALTASNAVVNGATTTTALPASAAIANNAVVYMPVRAYIQANATTGGTVKLQITNSAGTVTLGKGSHIIIRRLSAATTTGAFA